MIRSNGYRYPEHARGWGYVVKLKSGRWQASYVGPDRCRHYAPGTFAHRVRAEGWLASERELLEPGKREHWTPPKERAAAASAPALTLSEYATRWIEQRNIKPGTRQLYESQHKAHIEPALGHRAITSITPEAVRAWFAALGTKRTRRNSQVYGLLHSILATAVSDGHLDRNPCQIVGVMNPVASNASRSSCPWMRSQCSPIRSSQSDSKPLSCFRRGAECAGARSPSCDAKMLVSIASILNVSRGVTRRDREYHVDTTKSGKCRTVVVPPHIRDALKHHLANYVERDAEALLFPAARGGHMNDRVFSREYFAAALKAINRQGVRVHDLRHFAGTQVARVGNLAESMARLGHSTVKASLIYQGIVNGRDAEIAAALSALATGVVEGG